MSGWWFWALVIPAQLLAIGSLAAERGKREWVKERLPPQPPPAGWPPASVIVPVKGPEQGLRENLRALAEQDYPDYELIVAAQQAADVPEGVLPARAKLVLAPPGDRDTGEKIRNLLAAVQAARPESEVLAFADSDGIPGGEWLKSLISVLQADEVGAATGYRWYFPEPLRPGGVLRSVWNAAIAGTFAPAAAFAWGGATAIRRRDFENLRIAGYWRGHVSDDWRLTHAVRAAGKRIAFAPGAMVASVDSISLSGFLDWATRQLILTRVHQPKLWWASFVATAIYCASMAACLAVWIEGSAWGAAILLLQLGLGAAKSHARVRLARQYFPNRTSWLDRHGWLHLALTGPATWIWLYTHLRSAASSVIEWRGNRYRLGRDGAKRL